MLLGLALNHGVILDFKGSYLASSPDELSLLNAAKFMGVTMLARDLEKIQIEVKGQIRTYEILFVIEFTSTRKRMTTVLRSPQG
jgi:magnesium-transporting ATPase (P-type)